MRDDRAKASSVCVYCGIRAVAQTEHVIAKVFFEPPLPKMVTVPSCFECSRGRGDGGPRDIHLDEDYFRTVLCLQADMTEDSVPSRLLRDKVVRSLERSGGFARAILGTTKWVEIRTPQGIIVPEKQATFQIENARIDRVVRKIVRGLFYAKAGIALPPQETIDVMQVRNDEMWESALAMFNEPKWHVIDPNVFAFLAARKSPESFETVWLLVFYRRHAFFASTWKH